ncbi:hypothetical protein OFY73_005072 [Salmonella enterica]|nr:hypothetical protein [Salmonella enterica]EJA5049483.1 hypothetical protein [Salmonella enterica]EJA5537910.1 hypothetical protein [Salmonella enterica]EKP2119653.1 hypothetical protein [Salmonella enterica]EKP2124521.1 hypothetical protein [Salmonella enterica]
MGSWFLMWEQLTVEALLNIAGKNHAVFEAVMEPSGKWRFDFSQRWLNLGTPHFVHHVEVDQ